jgi:hypothetical protein
MYRNACRQGDSPTRHWRRSSKHSSGVVLKEYAGGHVRFYIAADARSRERVSFRARVVERDAVVLNNGLATVAA